MLQINAFNPSSIISQNIGLLAATKSVLPALCYKNDQRSLSILRTQGINAGRSFTVMNLTPGQIGTSNVVNPTPIVPQYTAANFQYMNVSWAISNQEQVFYSNKEFWKQISEVQSATMIAGLENLCLNFILNNTYNYMGTPGTAPSTQQAALSLITNAKALLSQTGWAPLDDQNLYLVTTPAFNAQLVQGFAGLFNPSGVISKIIKTGVFSSALGMMVVPGSLPCTMVNGTSTNLAGATISSFANGTNNTCTLTLSSALNGTVAQGQLITIANLAPVHYQTKNIATVAGMPQSFVVTQAAASGATTITVSPSIITSGVAANMTYTSGNSPSTVGMVGSAGQTINSAFLIRKNALGLLTQTPGLGSNPSITSKSYTESVSSMYRFSTLEYLEGNSIESKFRIDTYGGPYARNMQAIVRLIY